ncbi:methylated-DNA--[protein]-cysteine S-methyltransferase [Methylopila sp. Yamaguchi]|uniref:methylated-DNA--[protein]-cysteine S-methyltransferase n=1 Tax=Methylopila sp. Yamaguchi TaxID=1437817 RepID=UPI000CAF9335|nr:methylated-DNA--[protein]-cysteine S-methyltransferase [Methylopila sp. Yamaguchi]GBD47203.1 methylated-DNA--protein-cysteine methyltransferase [Methylopila sp. Yamaguchi]
MDYARRETPSPVGRLTLLAGGRGLAAVLWENDDPRRVRLAPAQDGDARATLDRAEAQLAEYFRGERRTFELDLDLQGTPFQTAVWRALLAIPFGETRSYAAIAAAIGRPDASRAVGAANGRNPLSIVAPCHRVVGTTGKLTGFAGGLAAKAFLLALERGAPAQRELFAPPAA